jgi:spore germination protein GerM
MQRKLSIRAMGKIKYKSLFIIFWLLLWPAPGMLQAADNKSGKSGEVLEDGRGRLPVYLYYADSRYRFLTGEARRFPPAEDAVSHCRLLVEALVKGPTGDLIKTVPEDTRVLAIYLTRDKTAWIDLSREVAVGPGGIQSEMMTLYAVVNTVVLNMPEVDQVKFLIEGQEAETLAGHIDIRFPFKANILLIR